MLLAFDVGNTNITIGLFEKERLAGSWRLETARTRTGDEYGLLVRLLLEQSGHHAASVDAVIGASVVPPLSPVIRQLAERVFGVRALMVEPGVRTGLPILYDPPKDVGADRIVNAVAAYARFESACIVVDFGTATTFDCITAKGEYAGGAIAPGIQIAMDALFSRTAKLPRVEVARPERAIGRNTNESIQSGTYFGYVAMVDGLVERLRVELGAPVRVMATGGLASVIASDSKTIEAVDPDLTLVGLRLIWERNR
ncbi:MAG: type III pantothenate kinase [Deltaproteobacteria bacterium]|nr:type III pantothenate kinase [Deltaproteobacteria bacterium]